MTSPAKPTILIVEDNPAALEALGHLVGQSGWQVLKAGSGFEASTYLHSGLQPPEVVLVDLMIPDPPGQEIIRLIRDMNLRTREGGLPIRVVAYTGCDITADTVELAIRAGADAVILKPATLETTLAVIRGESPGDVPIPPQPKGTP